MKPFAMFHLMDTLGESIKLAGDLVDVLSRVQEEAGKQFTKWNSFTGLHGTAFTKTVKCLKSTMDSWKALVAKLNYLDASLTDKVNPHVITNESIIEHSFGFLHQKGQGQLQTMYEYLHSKVKCEIDFQLRMSDCPFNQNVKTKLGDKAYQEIHEERKGKLSMDELWKILLVDKQKEDCVVDVSGGSKTTPSSIFGIQSCPTQI